MTTFYLNCSELSYVPTSRITTFNSYRVSVNWGGRGGGSYLGFTFMMTTLPFHMHTLVEDMGMSWLGDWWDQHLGAKWAVTGG